MLCHHGTSSSCNVAQKRYIATVSSTLSSTVHGARFARPCSCMNGPSAPIRGPAREHHRVGRHVDAEVLVVAIEIAADIGADDDVPRGCGAEHVIERVLEPDEVAAVVADPADRRVLGSREEATGEAVRAIVGPHHRDELGALARAVREEVGVIRLGVLLARDHAGVGLDGGAEILLAEIELPAVDAHLEQVVLLAMPPADRFGIEEVDAGAEPLPPQRVGGVIDEEAAPLAFLVVRRRTIVGVAADLDVEPGAIHHLRGPQDDADALRVELVEHALEVRVPRLVDDERVVVRLPR